MKWERDAARAIDRWLLKWHRPHEINGDPVCLHCRTEWPCDQFAKIDARIKKNAE